MEIWTTATQVGDWQWVERKQPPTETVGTTEEARGKKRIVYDSITQLTSKIRRDIIIDFLLFKIDLTAYNACYICISVFSNSSDLHHDHMDLLQS